MTYQVVKMNSLDQLNDVAPLFNEYRKFYQQPCNVEGAKDFLTNLFQNKLSVAFIAIEKGISESPVAFIQIYPMFSSVAMKKQWILNDLYVLPEHRKQGIATWLINKIYKFARYDGADRVILKTTKDNFIAKSCYEKNEL